MSFLLVSARIQSTRTILLTFNQKAEHLRIEQFTLIPHTRVVSIEKLEHIVLLHTDELDIKKRYVLLVEGITAAPVVADEVLNQYTSEKKLGCQYEEGAYVFRLFAPRAERVQLVLYESPEDEIGTTFDMLEDDTGVWELSVDDSYIQNYYGYRISGSVDESASYNPTVVVADPYARAVTRKNHYMQDARAIIHADNFDWEGDTPLSIESDEWIIYEMHVRDMTAHGSSGVPEEMRGTYRGLVHPGKRSVIDRLVSLGVSAVELMPVQEFATFEPPYKQQTPEGIYNTWNPYERNHWGYMTSFYLAPHSYYATGTTMKRNHWNGAKGQQVAELKEMIRAFHRAGIAVILDVVFNHTSQYDRQPLKYIDRRYYYHLGSGGAFRSDSGCGNDLNSARPMSRRLIIDSVLHWMEEYHVDGFRFDLAAMIDWDTYDELMRRAREKNPYVILIAEAWGGGGYDLAGFSQRGMAAWNDMFRNEVKGENPWNGMGFLFGTWRTPVTQSFRKWILGSTTSVGGPFVDAAHSVNYVESHDGYTLGDFIRIASGECDEQTVIRDITRHIRLSPTQARYHRLVAFVLMLAKGIPMLHAGQEFARSKIIARAGSPDVRHGSMDPNSYEKDDETNWLNYRHADLNSDLTEYYRGLIRIRRSFPELRSAPEDNYRFFDGNRMHACGFALRSKSSGRESFIVFVNSSSSEEAVFVLPDGMWSVLADGEGAGLLVRSKGLSGKVILPPVSGMFLVRETETVVG